MNRKLLYALAGFALILAILSSARLSSAAPPTNACSLLTPAQVSAVLGVSVGPGESPGSNTKLCHWASSGGTKKAAMVTLRDESSFAYAKMPAGNGVVKVPAKGIGDDAVYGTSPGVPTILTVKKGAVVFVVHVNGFSDDQIKEKEKALAQDILAKL